MFSSVPRGYTTQRLHREPNGGDCVPLIQGGDGSGSGATGAGGGDGDLVLVMQFAVGGDIRSWRRREMAVVLSSRRGVDEEGGERSWGDGGDEGVGSLAAGGDRDEGDSGGEHEHKYGEGYGEGQEPRERTRDRKLRQSRRSQQSRHSSLSETEEREEVCRHTVAVMEKAALGGDMYVAEGAPPEMAPLTEKWARFYIAEMLLAMEYLHRQR